jgi:glc operon protein GlcG
MHAMKRTLAVLVLAAVPVAADTQVVGTKKTLTLEGAKKAIAAAVAEARKNNATGVIAIVDDGGNLMALERIDGTFAAGANISIGKARTAVLFKKPTRVFEDIIGKGRTAMVTVDFTPLQGGVPILVDGQVVAGIGVSGASSAAQDEEFAIAGANALAAGSN